MTDEITHFPAPLDLIEFVDYNNQKYIGYVDQVLIEFGWYSADVTCLIPNSRRVNTPLSHITAILGSFTTEAELRANHPELFI